MKINKKGFTLIELLIVIAIIGILASVVLVSLSGARTKAKVANFKSQAAALSSKAVIACDGASGTTIVAADLGGSLANNYSIPAGNLSADCGPSGGGTFSFVVTAANGITCTATVTNTGVTTWAGADCI